MDRWLSVSDLANRWKCCAATARTRMRQMIHMERPMMARESAVDAWERARLRGPGLESAPKKKRRSAWEQPQKDETGKYIIPRRRA